MKGATLGPRLLNQLRKGDMCVYSALFYLSVKFKSIICSKADPDGALSVGVHLQRDQIAGHVDPLSEGGGRKLVVTSASLLVTSALLVVTSATLLGTSSLLVVTKRF